jgi:transposase
MKFEEIYERAAKRQLSQSEAAEILGMSERTFRCWRGRFEANGAEGLYDRRLGKASGRRVPVDTVMEVLALFDTRYSDFTSKHFFDKLVSEHGFERSYNWLRLTLQTHGRKRPAPRHEAHRRKRPRRPLSGMMLHQDGSTHQWVLEQWRDLIVTIANHLAWAKVPTIWHGPKCQPFGMGQSANHLAWAKKPCHFQTSGKTKISMLSPNFINLSRSLNFRRPGEAARDALARRGVAKAREETVK